MDIFVSLPAQTLELYEAGRLLRRFAVSSALRGPGELSGSFCTPRGKHIIRAKIGGTCPENAVLVARRPTGEVWTQRLMDQFPERDWILTRILWLSGCEPGFNRLGNVDTMRRFIYVHGTPDTVQVGVPGSDGCLRMRNRDIMDLYDLVPPFTAVNIGEFRVDSGSWTTMARWAQPVRKTVFVIEQQVPLTIEWDGADQSSTHAVAFDSRGNAVGTGRLLADGHIGRMAVLPGWRGKGVGAALLRRLMEIARARGDRLLALNAQRHAAEFYGRYGFSLEGGEFMEAGIPHITMTLRCET